VKARLDITPDRSLGCSNTDFKNPKLIQDWAGGATALAMRVPRSFRTFCGEMVGYILIYTHDPSLRLRAMPDRFDDAHAPVRAKLFWNGRSQAVRLPKEFRFEGTEVEIRKQGDAVILEPVARAGWPDGFFERIRENAHVFADLEVPPPLPAGGTEVQFDDE
jgi:virulence-associated protein VagC